MATKKAKKKAPAKAGAYCDWRDATQYPDEELLLARWREQGYFPDERTLLSMWRWEFLRRLPQYREGWAEQHARSQTHWDQCFATEGVMNPAQQRRDFDLIGASHLSGLAERFGLEIVWSPDWEFRIVPGGVFRSTYGGGYSSSLSRETDSRGRFKIDASIDKDQMLIVFDLSLPLKPQLERAAQHLEAVQAESMGAPLKPPRHHRRLWRKYLRVLDARDAGETFESIWESIELEGAGVEEFDARADSQNWAASGRQLWLQAAELMDKLAAKT